MSNVDYYASKVPQYGHVNHAYQHAVRGVKQTHRDMLQSLAGYLYFHGFLDGYRVEIQTTMPHGRTSRLDALVDDAVDHLKSSGLLIVPAWWTLAYWVFRWIVLPFLYDLLDEYSRDRDTTTVSITYTQL
jgi:hypothetical protein